MRALDEYWFDRAEVSLREIKEALRANGLTVMETSEVDRLKTKISKLQKVSFDCFKAWDNLGEFPDNDEWLVFADAIYDATKGLTRSDLEAEK